MANPGASFGSFRSNRTTTRPTWKLLSKVIGCFANYGRHGIDYPKSERYDFHRLRIKNIWFERRGLDRTNLPKVEWGDQLGGMMFAVLLAKVGPNLDL
jgi:hypothetical protein